MMYRKIIVFFLISIYSFCVIAQTQPTSGSKELEIKSEVMSEVNGMFELVKEKIKDGKLKNVQNALDRLTGPQELPMGFIKNIDNAGNSIALFFAQSANEENSINGIGTLFVQAKLPFVDFPIFFGVKGLSLKNFGLTGNLTLSLIGDVPISLMNGKVLVTLKGSENIVSPGGDVSGQTFATLSCNGIEELSISAEVTFSKDLLIPLDPNQYTPFTGDQRVTTKFQVVAKNFEDILVTLNLPLFTAKSLNGFAFNVNKAVLDLSNNRNSADCKLPTEYTAQMPNLNYWQGVCVSEFDVILPQEFKKKSKKDNPITNVNQNDTNQKKPVAIENRISLHAKNLLIDHTGISGNFSGKNLMSLNEGDASGWDFSLDFIEVEVVKNNLQKAAFKGEIIFPVDKDAQHLSYQGNIQTGGNFEIEVGLKNEIKTNLFGLAKLNLLPNSSISLKSVNGDLKPKAVLNGDLILGETNDKSDKANSAFKATINFEELTFITESPYISLKSMNYKGKPILGGFPVQITEMSFKQQNDILHFIVGVDVNIMQDKLKGGTVVDIGTKINRSNDKTDFTIHSFDILEINVEGKFSKVDFKARIRHYKDDPIYGNGYKGEAKLNIELDPKKIEIEAKAIFGTVNNFRYFFFEFGVSGLEIQAGPIEINSIRGGFSYKMRRQISQYIPDEKFGLGLKAMIGGGIIKKEAMAATLGFEINFNHSLGLKNVGLFGSVTFLPPIDQIKKNSSAENTSKKMSESIANQDKAPDINSPKYFQQQALTAFSEPIPSQGLYAKMGIYLDVDNGVFVASFDVYMNIADGMIKGTGENNKAGWGELYVDKKDWHLYLGTPQDKWGVSMNLGASMKATFYLMTGNHGIPEDLPPPPPALEKIIDKNAHTAKRSINSIGTGAGFALGASLELKLNLDLYLIYANMEMGLGFDILMRKYEGVECKNRTGSIGNNGWYAKGQFYAYMNVDIGVKVDVWFYKGKYSVLKGSLGSLLKVELPNPTWVYGKMAGSYAILGGLVSGKFDFDINIGEKCEMVAAAGGEINPLAGMTLINDITPASKSNEVSVFSTPQVVFAFPLEKEFKIEESTPPFRITLQSFVVQQLKPEITWENIKNAEASANFDKNVKEDVKGTQLGTTDEKSVSKLFKPFQVLPPESIYQIKVTVKAQEKVKGAWKDIISNGKTFTETRISYFQTGLAPNYIPKENIVYMYPVEGQEFYLPGESNQGYIRLDRGQDYLFANTTKYDYFLQFENTSTKSIQKVNFTSKDEGRLIEWQMPAINLSQKYEVNLFADPKIKGISNTGVAQVNKNVGSTTIKENKAEGNAEINLTIQYLNYAFKSSAYNTFKNKMEAKKITRHYAPAVFYTTRQLMLQTEGGEGFDEVELLGNPYTNQKPFIKASIIFKDPYFVEAINPLIYSVSQKESFDVQVPYEAMKINEYYLKNPTSPWLPFYYNAFIFYEQDRDKVVRKLFEKYPKGVSNVYAKTIFNSLPSLFENTIYEGFLEYFLPDGKKTNSNYLIQYKY